MKTSLLNLSTPKHYHSLRRWNTHSIRLSTTPNPQFPRRFRLITLCSSNSKLSTTSAPSESDSLLFKEETGKENQWRVEIKHPLVPPFVSAWASHFSLSDRAIFLLSFIACTSSLAFTSLVVVAVPTLNAMGRAANSLAKLADTAHEELPSTMAAIRLSSMEISDLTLELGDLSREISDGVSKSSQAVQVAEAGVKQIGSLARQQTISMIQERANLPTISLQPVVSGATRKTSHAVSHAMRTFMNIISRGDIDSENNENDDESSDW